MEKLIKNINEIVKSIDNEIAKNPLKITPLPETRTILLTLQEEISDLKEIRLKLLQEIGDYKDKLHRRNKLCNAREKKIKQLEQRLEWVLTQTNVHGVYKNDQDCIKSIRDYIYEYEHSNRLLRNKNV